MTAAQALADALEHDRRRQVCDLAGVTLPFGELFGPMTRGCGVGLHELCDGRFYVLGAPLGPCLCKCRASEATDAL